MCVFYMTVSFNSFSSHRRLTNTLNALHRLGTPRPISQLHRWNILRLIFWDECLDKDNDVCMPGHKKKAFCGVIYCSNRPWQQLDSMVINITTLSRRELGIPTHWTCSKEQMVTFSPQATIFPSRLQWHSCLLRGYRTIRESKVRWWPLPHRLWSALSDALAHKGTRRTQAHRNMVLLMLGVALALSWSFKEKGYHSLSSI